MRQSLVCNDESAIAQKGRNRCRKPRSKALISLRTTRADIAVDQGNVTREPCRDHGQGVFDAAEDQMIVVWNAVRMGPNLAFEHEDLSSRQALSQMVISTAIAQAKLEDGARQPSNGRGCHVETGALGLQTTNEAI